MFLPGMPPSAVKILLLCFSALFAAEACAELPPLRFYVTEVAAPNPETELYENTRRAIEKAIAPRPLDYRVLPISEITRHIQEGSVDLLIAGAGRYRANLRYGLRDIATSVSSFLPDPNHAVGSVIVVRGNNARLKELKDLKGTVVAVNDPAGFQGIYTVYNELFKAGFDPDSFFKEVVSVGMKQLPALDLVRSGKADVAVLNSCLIEVSAQHGSDLLAGLRIINEKKRNSLKCRVSTELYPNWSLLITPNMDVETLRKIMIAINAMPLGTSDLGWGMATDYSAVDSMYVNLKRGPFEYLREWTVKRVWDEYGAFLLMFLFGVAGLAFHGVRVSHLVEKRTAQLKEALDKEKELNERVKTLTERNEKIKRSAIVAQISSIVAHELSQPLAGILLYASGLQNMTEKLKKQGAPEASTFESVLAKIIRRAEKADQIVKTVRNYAKSGKPEMKLIEVNALIEKSVREFQSSDRVTDGEVSVLPAPSSLCVRGSVFDLELAVVNVLRNAHQAAAAAPHPTVKIFAREEEETAAVCIEDNGPGMSDEKIAVVKNPLMSVKASGLGLGLSIVRSILQSHGGELKIARSAAGGLLVTLELPKCIVRE
jgi:two-component system sensor histidine kinase TtrS